MSRSTVPGGEAGSIVIEALVAALIVAAAAGALFGSLSQGARADRAAAAREQALLVARSALATATADPPAPGTREGHDGPLVWRVVVSGYPVDGADRIGPVELVTVTVHDGSGGGPLARLSTLRFGR